ncbi:predicted protein [Postia placenta Mad-698-R]|nr:predicted protein [Postia placenta Mad-698-R]
MDILHKNYPDEDHIFVLDNATTHCKHADDALSAQKMPKFPSPSKPEQLAFDVDKTKLGEDGKPIYGPDGKQLKERVNMSDGRLPNGSPQSLYFPVNYANHELVGKFKGMANILEEHGFKNAKASRAECIGFKCKPDLPHGFIAFLMHTTRD